MDGIAEKFSVVDFFNLIIGGIVFIIGLVIYVPYLQDVFYNVLNSDNMSTVATIFIVLVFLVISLVMGLIVYEIGRLVFRKPYSYQDKLINSCLNDFNVVGNPVKLKIYRKKAMLYFKIPKNEQKKYIFSENQCKCFFAHCIYYIQIREQNKKTERLREVQELSRILLMCFGVLTVIGFFICLWLSFEKQEVFCQLALTIIYMIFSVIFYKKSKRDTENRIRMVLSVYDVCVDKELKKFTC